MRRVVYIMCALLLPSGAARAQTAGGLKIGYINSSAIVAESADALAAQEQFQREMVPLESELQAMEAEIGDLMNRYQAQQVTLSPDVRRNRQQEIGQKQQAYQTRMDEIEAEAARRQQELVAPIMERINGIIQQIRQEGSYTFIFDVAAGGLIAADESLDLTDDVIQRLAQGG
jgi:outer membrane protein